MTIVHKQSLDLRNISLSAKRKEALKKLKEGCGYNSYILKQDGKLLKYEIASNGQGYTLRTLLPG